MLQKTVEIQGKGVVERLFPPKSKSYADLSDFHPPVAGSVNRDAACELGIPRSSLVIDIDPALQNRNLFFQ